MNQWEVWYARFPYEDDESIVKERPVIILNFDTIPFMILVYKSTRVYV